LLDEATSALDAKAEKCVQDALDRIIMENDSGCTIIIAHRLTTVKDCDKIIVIDDGCKVEEGCHNKLMQIPVRKSCEGKMLSGWYRDLWDAQMGEEGGESGAKSAQVLELEEEIRMLEWQLARRRMKRMPASSRCASLDLFGLE